MRIYFNAMFTFIYCDIGVSRLHARGLKTLKDRTRLQNVEFRLGELSRDITYVRKELAFKPG